MAQQTAVEWLVQQIKNEQNQKALSPSEWMQVIEQAKAMEQDQLLEFWVGGIDCAEGGQSFDQYYEKTYGQ